jgi:hypothetical protein
MVGGLMEEVPRTKLFDLYVELKGMNTEQRLSRAKQVDVDELVGAFHESIAAVDDFFSNKGAGAEAFRPEEKAPPDRVPGLDSTHALARHLIDTAAKEWVVAEDETLNFFYLDRELVTTRLPGARLAGGKSTKAGPSVDLLLANARTKLPILAEVKLTRASGGTDKDPFYALIQALACAAYVAPSDQLSRLQHQLHGSEGRLDPAATRLEVFLLIGSPHDRSKLWNELRGYAQSLAEEVGPRVAENVSRIAGLELYWGKSGSDEPLSIEKWFG